jgi:hypothetical protein
MSEKPISPLRQRMIEDMTERQRTGDAGQQLQLQVASLPQRQRETGRLAPMQLMRISTAPRPPTASSDVRLGNSSAIISISMMTTLPAPVARPSLAQRQTVGAEPVDRRHQEERQCRGLFTWRTRRRLPQRKLPQQMVHGRSQPHCLRRSRHSRPMDLRRSCCRDCDRSRLLAAIANLDLDRMRLCGYNTIVGSLAGRR